MSTQKIKCPKHPDYKGARRTRRVDPGCYCIRVYDAEHPLGSPQEKDGAKTLTPIVIWRQSQSLNVWGISLPGETRWRFVEVPPSFDGGCDKMVTEEWLTKYHNTSYMVQQEMIIKIAKEINHGDIEDS